MAASTIFFSPQELTTIGLFSGKALAGMMTGFIHELTTAAPPSRVLLLSAVYNDCVALLPLEQLQPGKPHLPKILHSLRSALVLGNDPLSHASTLSVASVLSQELRAVEPALYRRNRVGAWRVVGSLSSRTVGT